MPLDDPGALRTDGTPMAIDATTIRAQQLPEQVVERIRAAHTAGQTSEPCSTASGVNDARARESRL